MKTCIRKIIVAAILSALLSTLSPQLSTVFAQGAAFTYQGRLNDGANPASGVYDLQFAVYDSTNQPGTLVAGPITNSATGVTNGLFAVTLDFGVGVFTGPARWLDIGVRTNSSINAYQTLSPRQPLTPAPYAITAGNVVSGGLASGTYGNAVTLSNTANQFSGSFTGNGAGLTNVNAAALGGLASSGFWQLGGNSVAGGQFLGSTNNQALELNVNSRRALRLEPTGTDAPNLIGGSPNNFIAPGIIGAVIGGGGTTNAGAFTNSIASKFGTISGGAGNTIQSSDDYSFVGGGLLNTIQPVANLSVIAGGDNNVIQRSASGSAIGGGFNNVIGTNSTYVTIAAGQANSIGTNSSYGVIGGGFGNQVLDRAASSTIAGGNNNLIQAAQADGTIGGGWQNVIQSGSDESTISGGDFNTIQTNNYGATIAGGYNNTIQAGGGEAAMGGGYFNTIQTGAQFATVGGGRNNTNSGSYATVPGGDQNVAGTNSFAAGHRAKATHSGSFVWADATDVDLGTTGNNQFLVRASGGAQFSTAGAGLMVDGSPVLTIGGASLGLTLQQNSSGAPNVIEGAPYNFIADGVVGATIGGGGATNLNGLQYSNSVSAGFGTIGGGENNTIQTEAFRSTIGGGAGNTIQTNDTDATIGGGFFNTIQTNANSSTIGGGEQNTIQTNAFASTIGGGYQNTASGRYAAVPGGDQNAAGTNSFAAGHRAKANHSGSFVWADATEADFASTGNNQFLIRAGNGVGIGTTAPEAPLHVAEGSAGTVTANANSIAAFERSGNVYLSILSPAASEMGILFGDPNSAQDGGIIFNSSGARSGLEFRTGTNTTQMTILANGNVGIGTISPSRELEVQNAGDTEIGIKSTDTGGHLWTMQSSSVSGSANLDASFQIIDRTLNDSRFYIGTNGFVGIGTTSPTNKLHVAGGVSATIFVMTSDRNAKENFQSICPSEVLDKVVALPITEWTFKEMPGQRHLGPMAQDFHAAFGLGANDTGIATVDEGGVALAAIQGLNQKIEVGSQRTEIRSQKSEESIQKLEAENRELKQRLAALEKIVLGQKSN